MSLDGLGYGWVGRDKSRLDNRRRMRHYVPMSGRQLRRLRLARGLSTAAAAKIVGVSRRTWVRWEALPKVPETASRFVTLLWKEGE